MTKMNDGKFRFESTSGQPGPKPGGRQKTTGRMKRRERKLEKAKLRFEKTGEKMVAAREKVKAAKPGKIKGAPKTFFKAAGFNLWAKAHGEIQKAGNENEAVSATYHAGLLAEHVEHKTLRFVKKIQNARPERKAARLEKRHLKASADYRFRQIARDNPQLTNRQIKKLLHKKRIQRKFNRKLYGQARKLKLAAFSAVRNAGKTVVMLAAKNPVAVLLILVAFLLAATISSCAGSALSLMGGMGGAYGATTYPSEDMEMLGAEALYAGWENDLAEMLANYPDLYPGYDEYRITADETGHDPYVLISLLSASFNGAWTVTEARPLMEYVFERQYTLTRTETVEIRYRTETRIYIWLDGHGETQTGTYEVEVPYNYYILTVTLKNNDLSRLPVQILTEVGLHRYALYMATLGNRPDLFPVSLYPGASVLRGYENYDIPPELLADEKFAAMITEAVKYLGYPYVWGGSNPQTSFDCSGYVSWVLNNSGWNVGRATAQGLFNFTTPVSGTNAKPGDLVFFTGTYNTPGVSHVGIYVGNGMMIHCGNPISFTSINTAYWQKHFYAFGRLP